MEQDKEQVRTTGTPVVDSSPNYEVREEPQSKNSLADFLNVDNRDAAQAAKIVRTSRGWRVGPVMYLSEFDAEAARQRLEEREKVS